MQAIHSSSHPPARHGRPSAARSGAGNARSDATQPFRCGPAGWSYPMWDRLLKEGPYGPVSHPLEALAGYFDLVEVNASFHRPLRPETAHVWLRKVQSNPDFVFTVKLAAQFTHERNLEPGAIQAFKEGLWPIQRAGRLGALLMQFPWAFRFTAENRDFLIELRRTFFEFPLVAEFRHASWLWDEARGVLVDYKVGFVNIDQPEYAQAMPPAAELTSPIGYARFHGRNRENWFPRFRDRRPSINRHDYLYSQLELESWRSRLAKLKQFAAATFVVMNNEEAGKSLVNAFQLRALMEGRRPRVPARLRELYPGELRGYPVSEPRQTSLLPLFLAAEERHLAGAA